MKKFVLILLTLCINSGAMEESQSDCCESNADEWQQLLDIFLPKAIEVAKAQDITQNAHTQHECEAQSYSDNLWDLLPGEIKLQIFTCIPKLGHYDAVKNLMLVNHEYKELIDSKEFLSTFAYEIVKHNPAKALDVYAWAIEHQKRSLAEYLFSSYFVQYIEPKQCFDKETERLFIVMSMMVHNVTAARNIFCLAATQGNEILVRKFLAACSQPIYYSSTTSDEFKRAKAISTLCRKTGIGSRGPGCPGRKNIAPYECNPTPLARAIANHHVNIVQILCNAGTNIEYAYLPCQEGNGDGGLDYTAFNQAVFENDKEILKVLFDRSQNYRLELGSKFEPLIKSCLKNAVLSGKIEIAKLLLEELKLSLNVNDYLIIHDGEQMTPLMIAAYHGQSDMVHYLLSIGADVNMRSRNGSKEEKASMLAEKNGHTEIAAYLRSHESFCLISFLN